MTSSHGKLKQSYKFVAAPSHHDKQNASAWPRPSTSYRHTRADANLNLP